MSSTFPYKLWAIQAWCCFSVYERQAVSGCMAKEPRGWGPHTSFAGHLAIFVSAHLILSTYLLHADLQGDSGDSWAKLWRSWGYFTSIGLAFQGGLAKLHVPKTWCCTMRRGASLGGWAPNSSNSANTSKGCCLRAWSHCHGHPRVINPWSWLHLHIYLLLPEYTEETRPNHPLHSCEAFKIHELQYQWVAEPPRPKPWWCEACWVHQTCATHVNKM